jgi:hypothetical protein
MWPFKKEELAFDTVLTGIHLSSGCTYPVLSDNNEEYTKGIEKMKDILGNWITQDIKLVTEVGKEPDTSMAYAIRNIMLPLKNDISSDNAAFILGLIGMIVSFVVCLWWGIDAVNNLIGTIQGNL